MSLWGDDDRKDLMYFTVKGCLESEMLDSGF